MFLLMGDKYFPSKAEMAMWIVNNLYTIVSPMTSNDLVCVHACHDSLRLPIGTANPAKFSDLLAIHIAQSRLHSSTEMLVLAVLPCWPCEGEVLNEPCRIVPTTNVTFLSRRYKIVFSLDASPSAYSVNDNDSSLIIEDIVGTLRKCLCGLLRPFKACEDLGC